MILGIVIAIVVIGLVIGVVSGLLEMSEDRRRDSGTSSTFRMTEPYRVPDCPRCGGSGMPYGSAKEVCSCKR